MVLGVSTVPTMTRPASPAVTVQTPLARGARVWQVTTVPVSIWQVEEQPSPLTVLPSSHCSPESTWPSPHVLVVVSF